MTRTSSSALLLVTIALVLLGAPSFAEMDSQAYARGAKLYGDNCGRCHNPRTPIEHTDRDWEMAMQHMRIISGLPGKQTREILSFLKASNNPPPQPVSLAPPSQQPARQGAEIIQSLGCRGCHRIGGSGGEVGPSLDDVIERRGESYVREKIRDPRKTNATTVMPVLPLSSADIEAIVLYLGNQGTARR